MFELGKLDTHRQRRVARSLIEADGDDAFRHTLHERVQEALQDAVAAGEALGGVHSVPPIAVDNAADATFAGFFNALTALESAVSDRVVAPKPRALAAQRAAATLRLRAFPQGVRFLTLSMPLQHEGMTRVMDRLLRDEHCVEAVQTLGLGWLVEHMEGHMAPYGRVVKRVDNRDTAALSKAFHEAFRKLALRTLDHHEGDAAVRARLLGAHERESEAQRSADRSASKRRGKGAKTDG